MNASRLLSLAMTLTLLACGGGGGSSPPPKPDAVAPFGGPGGEDGGGGTPAGGAPQPGGETGGADGTVGGVVPPCECPRGVCDAAGACIDATPCEQDSQCLSDRICEAGACVAGCADDAACADSGRADRCVASRCVECTDDAECFGRSTCDTRAGLCISAESCDDSRECVGADVCDARSRRCEPPTSCAETGCPEGRVCDAAIGRCVFPATCQSSDECPVGQVCPVGRDRRCRPCVADDECNGTQRCVAGACSESECAADADCLGARTCAEGVCVAPACEDDPDEDNDTPEAATPLAAALLEATSCGDDADWYALALPASTSATVVVTNLAGEGELAVEVVDADGSPLAGASTPGLVEAVVVGPFNVERSLRIRVTQPIAPSTVRYSLEAALVAVAEVGCIDDAIDATVGDDAVENARAVRPAGAPPVDARFEGRSCGADEDWFCFDVAAGEALSIEGSVTQGNLTLNAALLPGAGGDPIREAEWTRGQMGAALTAQQRGTYCLRLRARSGEGGWAVRITTTPRAVADLCAAAEAPERRTSLDLSGSTTLTGSLGVDDLLDASCAAGERDGGEAIHVVDVLRPGLLIARVVGRAGGTLGDPVLSVRGQCTSALSELACVDDGLDPEAPGSGRPGPTEIRVALQQAGSVALVVGGIAPGARPEYELSVELLPLAGAPQNETCLSALPVNLVNGAAALVANLDRAADNVNAPCLSPSGPDAVWSLTLERRSRVAVRLDADFPVGAALVQRCGGAAESCGVGFDDAVVAAGQWYLVVEGLGPQARGRVNVRVEVMPDAAAPANEVCASAEPLAGPSGTLQGDTSGAANDLNLPAGNVCTGFASDGGEVVYRVSVEAGRRYTFSVEPEGGWDAALYILRGPCDNIVGQCLAGADAALTEQLTLDAVETEEVFVVVDGAGGERGPFTLTWSAE